MVFQPEFLLSKNIKNDYITIIKIWAGESCPTFKCKDPLTGSLMTLIILNWFCARVIVSFSFQLNSKWLVPNIELK